MVVGPLLQKRLRVPLSGSVAGIEVKASATVSPTGLAGLRTLAEAWGNRFACGVVLYDSGTAVATGEKFAAAPLSWLCH
jgi:uncharacterized protein